MYFLIIAVLALLVITRFCKMDQVSSVRHFRLAWTYLIGSVVINAAGHLIMANLSVADRVRWADVTNAAMLAVLAVSLYFWHKAVTADSGKPADNA